MTKIYYIYPDLLNLYGEYANLLVLKRALGQTGEEVEIVAVSPDDSVSLSDADFVYAGAGTEKRISVARKALKPFRGEFQAAAENGVPMLFTGSAAELTARELHYPDGRVRSCLGLSDCIAVRTDGRELGDILYASPLSEHLLAGFINKSGFLKGVTTPLFAARFGPGGILDADGAELPAEGVRSGNVIATYALGPILARNPWLKRWMAALILERKHGRADISGIVDDESDKGYEITVEELLKRAGR